MKRKILCLSSLTFFLLSGCSNGSIPTNGVIDCYSVEIIQSGREVYARRYSTDYSPVYEYKNSTGDFLYSSSYRQKTVEEENRIIDGYIRFYQSKYSEEYVEYTFVRFVGWLFVENNYYLDLDKGYLDIATEWSEYLYEKNPDGKENADNKEAYQKAKTGYYQVGSFSYSDEKDVPYCSARADLLDISLSRHSYKKLGDDCTVNFVPKWF